MKKAKVFRRLAAVGMALAMLVELPVVQVLMERK